MFIAGKWIPLGGKKNPDIISALVMNKAGSQDAPNFPCGQIALWLLFPFLPWPDNQRRETVVGMEHVFFTIDRHPGVWKTSPPCSGECHTARNMAVPRWRDKPAGRDMVDRAGTRDLKSQIQIPFLPLTSCDILGKSVKSFEAWVFSFMLFFPPFSSIKWEDSLSPRAAVWIKWW